VGEVLEGDNWVRYDPTPGSFQQVSLITNVLDNVRMAWYRNVVTYDLARQVQTPTAWGSSLRARTAVTSAFEPSGLLWCASCTTGVLLRTLCSCCLGIPVPAPSSGG